MYSCLGSTLNLVHCAIHFSSTDLFLLGYLCVPRSPTSDHFQTSLFKKGLFGSLISWVLKAKKKIRMR